MSGCLGSWDNWRIPVWYIIQEGNGERSNFFEIEPETLHNMQSPFISRRNIKDNFGYLIAILRINVYHSSNLVKNKLSSSHQYSMSFIFCSLPTFLVSSITNLERVLYISTKNRLLDGPRTCFALFHISNFSSAWNVHPL